MTCSCRDREVTVGPQSEIRVAFGPRQSPNRFGVFERAKGSPERRFPHRKKRALRRPLKRSWRAHEHYSMSSRTASMLWITKIERRKFRQNLGTTHQAMSTNASRLELLAAVEQV
jgi:hypothetical protein